MDDKQPNSQIGDVTQKQQFVFHDTGRRSALIISYTLVLSRALSPLQAGDLLGTSKSQGRCLWNHSLSLFSDAPSRISHLTKHGEHTHVHIEGKYPMASTYGNRYHPLLVNNAAYYIIVKISDQAT
jgi:hypothetical protein